MLTWLVRKRIAILIAVSLLSIVAAMAFLGRTYKASEKSYWPPMTMVYELDGQVYNGTIIRETHRLEYKSASDWTDTVIGSDPIETRALGTITATGSYVRRDGEEVKLYDSITDDTDVTQISESTVIPNQFLAPLHIFEEGAELEADPPLTRTGKTLSEVSTTTRICYQTDCENNASALTFDRGYGDHWTVLDDARWGIPLRVGDKFIVSELTLKVSKSSEDR